MRHCLKSLLRLCLYFIEAHTVISFIQLDWRYSNILTPIKQQCRCGSCWVHATLAVVEAQLVLQGVSDRPENLSVQPLLECARLSHGCFGDSIQASLNYLYYYGNILQADFARPHNCTFTNLFLPPARVFGIPVQNNVAFIVEKLHSGPLVVLISSKSDDFAKYRGGIYNGWCSSAVDHAMALVGVDTIQRYWILRNSWGTEWGERGYMRITFLSAETCGMLSHVTQVHLLPQYSDLRGTVEF